MARVSQAHSSIRDRVEHLESVEISWMTACNSQRLGGGRCSEPCQADFNGPAKLNQSIKANDALNR